MCDTDSVVCSIDLNNYPKIKERYQWDGTGEELGTLKNELNKGELSLLTILNKSL